MKWGNIAEGILVGREESWKDEYSPGQEPVNELPLLLHIARPVPLDVAVQLLLQRVAGVLRVKLSNLKINGHAKSTSRKKENGGLTRRHGFQCVSRLLLYCMSCMWAKPTYNTMGLHGTCMSGIIDSFHKLASLKTLSCPCLTKRNLRLLKIII